MKTIFVVTTMVIPGDMINTNKLFDNRSRSVGWFPKFEEAEIEVLNNSLDIHECNNDYCVIEECKQGLYDLEQKEHWCLSGTPTGRTKERNGKTLYEIKEYGFGYFFNPFLFISNKRGKKLKSKIEKLREMKREELIKINKKYERKVKTVMKDFMSFNDMKKDEGLYRFFQRIDVQNPTNSKII